MRRLKGLICGRLYSRFSESRLRHLKDSFTGVQVITILVFECGAGQYETDILWDSRGEREWLRDPRTHEIVDEFFRDQLCFKK